MKNRLKRNGGAVRLSRNEVEFLTIPVLIAALCFSAFGQLAVVSGGGPHFPLTADSVLYVAKFVKSKKRVDSTVAALDTGFYGEFKRSIDTTVQYVDAVRAKREEIGGGASAPKFHAVIHFLRGKKRIVQLSFSRGRMGSALLDVKSEKYPYVVTFKPEFAHKLDSIGAKVRRTSPPRPPLRPKRGDGG